MSPSRSPRERSSGCSAPTAPARPRPSRSWSASCAPDARRRAAGRAGPDRPADVPPRARRNLLSAAGAFGLPQDDGRAEPARDPRDARAAARPSAASAATSCSRSSASRSSGDHRAYTLSGGERRRVEIARSLVAFALLPPARRAVRRNRPDRGPRHPAIVRRLASSRHRRPGHGPQRPRDFVDLRPGLYNPRWRDLRAGTPLASRATPPSERSISESVSGSTRAGVFDGPGTETQPQAVAAAGDDAVAAAGDQAAADVAGSSSQEVLTQEVVENPLLEEEQERGRRRPPRRRAESARADRGRSARRPDPAEPPAEKERDSFEEIDFDSYFEDYLDRAYNPRQYQEEPEEFSLENTLTAAARASRST